MAAVPWRRVARSRPRSPGAVRGTRCRGVSGEQSDSHGLPAWRIRGEVQHLSAPPQVRALIAAVCKTVGSTLSNRWSAGQQTLPSWDGLGARMADMAPFMTVVHDRARAPSRQGGCGINPVGHAAPVTPGHPEIGHQLQELRYLALRNSAAEPRPNPHRSPTTPLHDGRSPQKPHGLKTAHSGTLVMRVKGTENSRSAASMRVSWAVGAFPDVCSQDDRAPEKRKLEP